MMVGVCVYVAADSAEELNYSASDLHVGWGFCVTVGVACVLLCIWCMYKHIRARYPTFSRGYLPITDEDEELIEV